MIPPWTTPSYPCVSLPGSYDASTADALGSTLKETRRERGLAGPQTKHDSSEGARSGEDRLTGVGIARTIRLDLFPFNAFPVCMPEFACPCLPVGIS